MTAGPAFLTHSVTREDRPDGSVLLRSGLALGPVADNTGDWLVKWAEAAPDRTFITERDGDGWRKVSFGELLPQVRSVAAGLLDLGLEPGQAIVVLSGPSIDHAVLTLAAQYVGIVTVPLAEQYALVPEARGKLRFCAARVSPAMVYAADGRRFAEALDLAEFEGVRKCVSDNPGAGMTAFEDLRGAPGRQVEERHAAVGHGTIAKILFTSGSTSDPKGVPQTQGMLCVNQAQYLACLPILGAKHHRMVDWLPWNHVFAGSSNFNMMLSNGGTWVLDDGKPAGPLAGRSIENLKVHQSTLSFDVPIAHAMQVEALRADPGLRRRYFEALDIFFYAGASLPPGVWDEIAAMSLAETGRVPMMMSSWGLTETAPMVLIYYERGAGPGMVGVPAPGIDVKLIPLGGDRYEIRVRGPNVFRGYLDDPDATAKAFDDEGFFVTGDAMRFVDPADASRGLRFDGRIGEDFKLMTGTWVQASILRLNALAELGALVQDLVVVGEGRSEVGLLVFPAAGVPAQGDFVGDPGYLAKIRAGLARLASGATGSSNRIARALVLAEPPSVGAGEITAKGSLNVRAILARRAALVDCLYDDGHPGVVRAGKDTHD